MSPNAKPTLLVTGTTGIAAATVHQSIASGWRVFVVGNDPESLAGLLAGTDPQTCSGSLADLRDTPQTQAAFETANAHLGRIDSVFAVAGISGRRYGDGPIDSCTDDGWAATLDGNLSTTFHTVRAALGVLRSQAPDPRGLRGSVVLMGSVLAEHPEPEFFATHAYAAAKGAIHSLTRTTAAKYAAEGIRVNAVAPGLVRTPMSARAQDDPEIIARLAALQPLGGTFLEPEDIADAALFLLDNRRSGRITGQVLNVDGGWSFGR